MCVLSVFVRSRSAESHGKASRDGGAAIFFVLLSPLSSLCSLFSSFFTGYSLVQRMRARRRGYE